MLPNKKLVTMNRSRVGDPQEGQFNMELIDEPYTSPGSVFAPYTSEGKRELFCAGHTLDENGNIIFSGGHGIDGAPGDGHGIPDVWLYKWETNQLIQCASMREGRWYPTVVQLPDRTMMFSMGTDCYHPNCPGGDCPGCQIIPNTIPEIWTQAGPSNYVSQLPARAMNAFYPVIVIRPSDGRAYFAATGVPGSGEDHNQASGLFNPATLVWEPYGLIPPTLRNVRRYYPSSAMIDGVLYRSGGSVWYGETDTPGTRGVKNTVKFTFDTNSWSQLPDMNFERLQHTLVSLPDARILAMGGGLYGPVAGGIERSQPEALDTENDSLGWTLLTPPPIEQRVSRSYHSVAILLPDASVLFAGGELLQGTTWANQKKPQIFTPQYGPNSNWKPDRPTIDNVQSEIRYGEPFSMQIHLATGKTLSKVRIISLPSVTHAYNENQQFLTLGFSGSDGNYTVNSPSDSFKATPGYYMLFAVDSDRVPSIAKIIKLKDFDRSFCQKISCPQVDFITRGSTVNINQTFVGDNNYLNSGLFTITGELTLNVRSYFTKLDEVTKLRFNIESRSTHLNTSCVLYMKSRITQQYQVVWSGLIHNLDKIDSAIIQNNNFIQNDGRIDAKISWTNLSNAFSIYVDKIEFGVR